MWAKGLFYSQFTFTGIVEMETKSYQFKLYQKPEFKAGWRNYQVDLKNPVKIFDVLEYNVKSEYEYLDFNRKGKSFLISKEFGFILYPNQKMLQWLKLNTGKSFIIFCENVLIINGAYLHCRLKHNYPELTVKVIVQIVKENNRAFYIPKHKALLLPHNDLKYLYQ